MTGRSKAYAYAAALLVAFTMPAFAQTGGTLMQPEPALIPKRVDTTADARQAMYDYSACLARRTRSRVEYFLRTFPGSKEAREVGGRIAVSECLIGSGLRFSEPVFRGGAYEALYRIDYGKKGPLDFSAIAPLEYGEAPAASALYRDPGQQVALRKFAECAVRAKPGAARGMMLSGAGSAEEGKSFDDIMPNLQGCLPKDLTLRFSKSVVRGLIGEVLYRLSKLAVPNNA